MVSWCWTTAGVLVAAQQNCTQSIPSVPPCIPYTCRHLSCLRADIQEYCMPLTALICGCTFCNNPKNCCNAHRMAQLLNVSNLKACHLSPRLNPCITALTKRVSCSMQVTLWTELTCFVPARAHRTCCICYPASMQDVFFLPGQRRQGPLLLDYDLVDSGDLALLCRTPWTA